MKGRGQPRSFLFPFRAEVAESYGGEGESRNEQPKKAGDLVVVEIAIFHHGSIPSLLVVAP